MTGAIIYTEERDPMEGTERMSDGIRRYADMVAGRYGLDHPATRRVIGSLSANRVALIAMSGHMGSGKDTVAPLLMDRLGFPAIMREHRSFADPLRVEVGRILTIIRSSGTHEEAESSVSLYMGADMGHAQTIVRILWDDAREDGGLDGHSRSDSMRRALQYWGTEVRRAQDPDYWVTETMRAIIPMLDSGRSVYLTDARFPNELDAVHAVGGAIIRLLVSPEEQEARIMARDHVKVTGDMRAHPSETAVDGYEGFDSVVDTDGIDPEDVVSLIIPGLDRRDHPPF